MELKLDKTTKILLGAIALGLFFSTNIQAKSLYECGLNNSPDNCETCKYVGKTTFAVDKSKDIVLQKLNYKSGSSKVIDWSRSGLIKGKCNIINKNNFTCQQRWSNGTLLATLAMFDGEYTTKVFNQGGFYSSGRCGD